MLSNQSGPIYLYGDLDQLPASLIGAPPGPVLSPNPDAGPSAFYQWAFVPDVRFNFPKDQSTGRRGAVAGLADAPALKSIGAIPSAFQVNNIAAGAHVVGGTAMTLAAASVGISVNIPIIPFTGLLNGSAPVTAAMALDFGFGFGNCTSGSANVTVATGAAQNYFPGMPLVIAGVGNAAGTAPLLTQVASVNLTTSVITLISSAVPAATNSAAPIGTGNVWSPTGSNPSGAPLIPIAAYPFLAAGPGLLLDSGQAITRGIQIVGASGGAGGTFTVAGWDVFNQPMTETITVGAGAVTGWGKKAFKYIASVTPNFTDAHNYSVGTSDVFGFAWAVSIFENTQIFWAGALVTGTPTGLVAGLNASTASTSTTADVRGTVQTSTNGGGTGIGSTNSNGTVSSLAMTGNRLELFSRPSLRQMILSTQASPAQLYGPTQA